MSIILYMSEANYGKEVNRQLVDSLLQALGDGAELRHEASLKGVRPSLVHVMGCWNREAASMISKSRRNRVATVYSPLGGLMPWNIENHKAEKELDMLTFQKRMTADATAIHAFSELEERQLRSLGWNRHITLIGNPFTTGRLSVNEMTSRMLTLYQKTIDTEPQFMLGKGALKVIGSLLQAAVDKDAWHDEARRNELQLAMNQLTDDDWRYIWLYSSDELITLLLRQGLAVLKLQAPETDTRGVERFPVIRKYCESHLMIDTEDAASGMANVLKTMRSEAANDTMSMSHLADLYRLLRFTDYDEDCFSDIIHKRRMEKFTRRMLAILTSTMGLTEGFLPMAPLQDAATKRLANKITKIKDL